MFRGRFSGFGAFAALAEFVATMPEPRLRGVCSWAFAGEPILEGRDSAAF